MITYEVLPTHVGVIIDSFYMGHPILYVFMIIFPTKKRPDIASFRFTKT
jgi:hypothetical protein